MPPLTPFPSFAFLGVVPCDDSELRIHNTSEFITFSIDVNSGANYSGTTVYLESDLDFSGGLSEQFEPMGSYRIPFDGTFDGQGHTISNLVVNSSSRYVGLFGYSTGSIKNFVLGSSCSLTSYFTVDANVFLGGVVGYYGSNNEHSYVSNVVNMAGVTFDGNTTGNLGLLYLGGIVGRISSDNFEVSVKNCVNYGQLRHFGVADYASIGGIVGDSSFPSKSVYIQNCLNYGAITVTGTAKTLYAGGILGASTYTTIENCVSAGSIPSNLEYKGGISGYVYPDTNITHCLWTSDVGCGKTYGDNATVSSITSSSLVSINATTVDELNEYASNNGWNRWLLNIDNKSFTFKIYNN